MVPSPPAKLNYKKTYSNYEPTNSRRSARIRQRQEHDASANPQLVYYGVDSNYTTHYSVTLSEINTIQLQDLHLVTPEPFRTDLVFLYYGCH